VISEWKGKRNFYFMFGVTTANLARKKKGTTEKALNGSGGAKQVGANTGAIIPQLEQAV